MFSCLSRSLKLKQKPALAWLNPNHPSVLRSPLGRGLSALPAALLPEAPALPVAACPHHFPHLFLSIPHTDAHKTISETPLEVSAFPLPVTFSLAAATLKIVSIGQQNQKNSQLSHSPWCERNRLNTKRSVLRLQGLEQS